MTFSQLLITIFEFLMVAALLWGVLHEDRLAAFERRLAANIRRRRLRVVNTSFNAVKAVKQ